MSTPIEPRRLKEWARDTLRKRLNDDRRSRKSRTLHMEDILDEAFKVFDELHAALNANKPRHPPGHIVRLSDAEMKPAMDAIMKRIKDDPGYRRELTTKAGLTNADGTLTKLYGGTDKGPTVTLGQWQFLDKVAADLEEGKKRRAARKAKLEAATTKHKEKRDDTD